jgi:hypothetical protein
MILPKDPALKDIQVLWESLYWYKKRATWKFAARAFDLFVQFFGADRKPRDIFRSDVAEFQTWLTKKGCSKTGIETIIEYGRRLYRVLDERELVEKDFNPFKFSL